MALKWRDLQYIIMSYHMVSASWVHFDMIVFSHRSCFICSPKIPRKLQWWSTGNAMMSWSRIYQNLFTYPHTSSCLVICQVGLVKTFNVVPLSTYELQDSCIFEKRSHLAFFALSSKRKLASSKQCFHYFCLLKLSTCTVRTTILLTSF